MIFAKQEKCQNFDLENEGQGIEQRDLRHLTGNVQIHTDDFFRILATWEYMFTQKLTRTHTLSERREGGCDDYRQNLQSRFVS